MELQPGMWAGSRTCGDNKFTKSGKERKLKVSAPNRKPYRGGRVLSTILDLVKPLVRLVMDDSPAAELSELSVLQARLDASMVDRPSAGLFPLALALGQWWPDCFQSGQSETS